ncbi:MAG: DUF6036 family nucleotidyltransferase [Verrucomicrobiota bacterium]
MRQPLTETRLRELFEKMGAYGKGPGTVYVTGGATAVLFGWRSTTIDVDLKMDPEPSGVFEAIAQLKDEMQVNIELAAPDQFVPALPGWRERSRWIASQGEIDFYHYDFYGQALSKIERGLEKDWGDVEAMVQGGLVETKRLLELFGEVESKLVNYPAIDPGSFKAALIDFIHKHESD